MSHRTQITLTDEQYDRLRHESARSGLGLAELVRRALDRSYGTATDRELLDALGQSFGSWTERHTDGAEYVDGLRRGMAQRLTRG
ncbi:MAG TPA: CopG family transcriptional regulator [Actinomycetota bacterium]|nr:CopG family transcriptional regulator [Actinomycetota bacterium]